MKRELEVELDQDQLTVQGLDLTRHHVLDLVRLLALVGLDLPHRAREKLILKLSSH